MSVNSKHAQRIHLCTQIVKSMSRDPSKMKQRITRDERSYCLLGHILFTLSLSPKQDIMRLCRMARKLLDLGADPNLAVYFSNVNRKMVDHSCYTFALFLSHTLKHGESLDLMLERFTECKAEVPPHMFDKWGQGFQMHAISRNAMIAMCPRPSREAVYTIKKHKSWARVQPVMATLVAWLKRLSSIPQCLSNQFNTQIKADEQAVSIVEPVVPPCVSSSSHFPMAVTVAEAMREHFKCTRCDADGYATFNTNTWIEGMSEWTECTEWEEYNHIPHSRAGASVQSREPSLAPHCSITGVHP